MIGALGVSGDTSCADHNVAWRTRDALELDNLVAGLSGPVGGDNIIFDIFKPFGTLNNVDGVSVSGFGHPTCLQTESDPAFNLEVLKNEEVIADHPLGPNP
jgi:hypothetical protein